MPIAKVTVQFVNQPKEGKKKGSIKTAELGYLGVWPDKLSLFTKGQSYEIEYKENGQYKDFERIIPQAHAPSHDGPKQNGVDNSRMIFITGIVGRAMGSGKFLPQDIRGLALQADDAYEALMQAKAAAAEADY